MSVVFILIALVTLAGAIAAMTLRNLVHCALALAVAFAGLAAFYLRLNAQFVGFAQVLIYIGAVTILIVFAILLTRGTEPPQRPIFSSSWVTGAAVALAVFALLSGVILSSKSLPSEISPPPAATVRGLGDELMTRYVIPLEVLGLLLTAALIGAVIIAMPESHRRARDENQYHPANAGNGELGAAGGANPVERKRSSPAALQAFSGRTS
jgi:NADH-quinone oxidoreductase subunit J